jgi:hypothetical protein
MGTADGLLDGPNVTVRSGERDCLGQMAFPGKLDALENIAKGDYPFFGVRDEPDASTGLVDNSPYFKDANGDWWTNYNGYDVEDDCPESIKASLERCEQDALGMIPGDPVGGAQWFLQCIRDVVEVRPGP